MAEFDELWDYSDPTATEARFRAVYTKYEEAEDASLFVELLTQIARAQGLQRRFDEAHETLDYADDFRLAGMTTPETRCLLERGRLFNSGGDKEQARGFFRAAFDNARTAGDDYYAVDAAHMLAIAAETPAEALRWNHEAIALAEKSKDEGVRRWLASLYNNTGWTHHDAGRYGEALDLFQRAVKLREAKNQPNEVRVAKWCVARTLRSMGRTEEALAMQRALLAEHKGAGSKDGYVFEELGECLLALGRTGEAKGWFAKAADAFEKDADFDAARLARIQSLAG